MSEPLVVEHRDIDAGGDLVLHAAVAGQGPPIVLLHGFTGSAGTWSSLVTTLAPLHQVIAVDLPGHGASSAPADPARYALPRLADDLARVLDTLGVARTALLGYSLGGRAALHFAVRHPGRLTTLVLESAAPGIADPLERRARHDRDAEIAAAIERDGVQAFVDWWERLPLWDSQQRLPAEVRHALRAQRLANDARGLANSLRGAGAAAEPVLAAELGAVTVPTLLLAGALDEKYVAIGAALAESMPDARLTVVPGAGHAVHLERPEAFAGLVRDWTGTR